ncbi:hypothetical protein Slin14017_G080440 [Septoria linicola]|nr:hypothetical protein Slin14017_G080440 [Septoria linicola]
MAQIWFRSTASDHSLIEVLASKFGGPGRSIHGPMINYDVAYTTYVFCDRTYRVRWETALFVMGAAELADRADVVASRNGEPISRLQHRGG